MDVGKRFQIDWNDERVDLLKLRWSEGHSAKVIAIEIGGGVTRNAVLGKIDRLKLSKRRKRASDDQPLNPRKTTVRKNYGKRGYSAWSTIPDEFEPEPVVIDDTADTDIPRRQRCTLMQLTNSTCRWPVGEIGEPDFFFCGAKPMADSPYCASHCARAYRFGYAAGPIGKHAAAITLKVK